MGTALELRQFVYVSPPDPKTNKTWSATLEQLGFRWLSRSMTAFQPKGCLTDLANLALHEATEENYTEDEVVKSLDEIYEKIKNHDSSGLWVPTPGSRRERFSIINAISKTDATLIQHSVRE